MERLLPVLQRSLCAILFLLSTLSISAQQPELEIQPPTFRDDCETLEFCVTGGPTGSGIFYIFRARDANNNLVQSGAGPNRCFRLNQPAETVTCGAYAFLGQPPLEEDVATVPSTVSSFFRLSASRTSETVCPAGARVINITAPRCIDETDWSRTIFGYSGAPTNGILANLGNASVPNSNVIGLQSRVDLVLEDGPGWQSGRTYRVRVTGLEVFTGRTGYVNIYVTTSFTCSNGQPARPRGDLTAEEMAVLDRAATSGLSDEEWENLDVDRLLERAYGVDASNLTVDTAPLRFVSELEVFPNPASGSVSIRYDARPDRLNVTDLNGRTLRSLTGNQLGEYGSRLELANLPAGLYLLSTLTGSERAVTKLRVR